MFNSDVGFFKLLRHFEPSLLPQGLYLFVSAHSKHLHAVFVNAEHRTDRRRKTESHGNIRCTFRDYDYSAYLWHTLSKYYRAFSPASGCFDRTRCLGYTRAVAAFLLIRGYNPFPVRYQMLPSLAPVPHSAFAKEYLPVLLQAYVPLRCSRTHPSVLPPFFLRIYLYFFRRRTNRTSKNRKSKYYKNRIQDRSQFLILFKCFCKHRKYRISVFHLYLRTVIFAFPHIFCCPKRILTAFFVHPVLHDATIAATSAAIAAARAKLISFIAPPAMPPFAPPSGSKASAIAPLLLPQQ